jgi:flagellar assembly factor FliW
MRTHTPTCSTKFHGTLPYESEQVFHIPRGLFGFPQETEFLLLELPSARPLTLLQSIRSADLCFISLPAQVIEQDYHFAMNEEDLEDLGYSPAAPPVMGKDILCLALLTLGSPQATTANLLAPIVVNIGRHSGMQVIVNAPYSHQHPFPGPSGLGQDADQ